MKVSVKDKKKKDPAVDYYSQAVLKAYELATQLCVAGKIDSSKVKDFAVELVNNMWPNIAQAKINNTKKIRK